MYGTEMLGATLLAQQIWEGQLDTPRQTATRPPESPRYDEIDHMCAARPRKMFAPAANYF